jgi:hypothetical protein
MQNCLRHDVMFLFNFLNIENIWKTLSGNFCLKRLMETNIIWTAM